MIRDTTEDKNTGKVVRRYRSFLMAWVTIEDKKQKNVHKHQNYEIPVRHSKMRNILMFYDG